MFSVGLATSRCTPGCGDAIAERVRRRHALKLPVIWKGSNLLSQLGSHRETGDGKTAISGCCGGRKKTGLHNSQKKQHIAMAMLLHDCSVLMKSVCRRNRNEMIALGTALNPHYPKVISP